MEQYKAYFDRQTISPDTHAHLLSLPHPGVKRSTPWARWGALAACAALILGLGTYALRPQRVTRPVENDFPLQSDSEGGNEDFWQQGPGGLQQDQADPLQPPESGFLVESPVEEGVLNFFAMPAIYYQDVSSTPQVSASRAFLPGSFFVNLEKEDIQKLFWGPEGIPESYQTEIGRQDLPWTLFWDGYSLTATVLYNGQGELEELNLYGDKPGTAATFSLTLSPGHLPFTCLATPDLETSDAFEVPVTGWRQVYDRDGDARTDYICGSEFMTKNDIGVRFETQNCGILTDPADPTLEETDFINAEAWFNTLLVRYALTTGLSLDHLLTTDHIPAWREQPFDTLAEARTEADFAPYLPETAPVSWSEFYGRLSYQEGTYNYLFVRWSHGYDDVEVNVHLPEDPADYYLTLEPVDVTVPESYDWRLYEGSISDSVPEEYRYGFFSPLFRAEDMSLEVVKARGREKDTGGMSYHFYVRHENDVVVSYSCSGVTAEQIWAMVEPTL